MRAGFSLVELSIVLVILGLLTGGILTGQTLIRAAELRGVTTELQNYQAAASTFRDKYFAIPGDMRNAEAFWTVALVANGNGDGVIGVDTAANARGENFQFWSHLAQAGLIEGTYTGSAVGGADGTSFGQNVPRSKLSNAGWGIFTDADEDDVTDALPLEYGNGLLFGAAVANTHNRAPALAPEEAWNIDTKVDDAQPGAGRVIAFPFTVAANCTTVNAANAAYDLVEDGTNCALIFRDQF